MEGAIETEVVSEALPPGPPPAPRPSGNAFKQMQREEEQDIKSWLDSLATEAAVKVVIKRKKPVAGPNGEKIDGILETVEDKVDEEYIREMWGGGDYFLQVQTQQSDGKYKYLKARTISIAGPPKMSGNFLTKNGNGTTETISASADDGLAAQAFSTMTALAKEERARADRLLADAGKSGQLDLAALQALNGPVIEQLRVAQETIARLQQQIITVSTQPPPRDEFRDKLLERAIGDESARIEHLRTMYEQRMEKLRDNWDDEKKRIEDRHAADLKRIEDRHNEEIRRMESMHEREMRSIEKNNDFSAKSLDVANSSRIESLKDEKNRLERELSAAQTKIATLEAKKDQSIGEKADELMKVKEALDGLGGGDKDEAPWYEKVLDTVGNSEALINLVNKVGGGPGGGGGGQPQQQQMALPPPGQPFQGPDGQIYVVAPNGQVVNVAELRKQKALAAARTRRAQRAAAAAGQPGVAPEQMAADAEVVEQAAKPVRPPKPAEVKLAVKFMESALNSPNTTPETFARGARNLVPADVLAFIQRVGIDEFLNKVVEPGSPLTTIRGRNFARAVAQILLQGEAPPMPVAPVGLVPTEPGDPEEDPGDPDDGMDDLPDDLPEGELEGSE